MLVSPLRALVVVLLLARVVAAPLALRPTSSGPHPKYSLVFRVSAWPPMRPQRFSSSSKLLVLLQGKKKACPSEGPCRLRALVLDCSARMISRLLGRERWPVEPAKRAIVCLRC